MASRSVSRTPTTLRLPTKSAPWVSIESPSTALHRVWRSPCHAKITTYEGIAVAQGGVYLETPRQIKAEAQRILKHAVLTHYMPLGNLTKITDEERKILGRWIRAGAVIDKGASQ